MSLFISRSRKPLTPVRRSCIFLLFLFSFLSLPSQRIRIESREVFVRFAETPEPGAPFPFEVVEEQLIRVSSGEAMATYVGTIFYDEQSQLESVEFREKKGDKWQKAELQDAAYKMAGIFHGDYRLATFGHMFERSGEVREFRILQRHPDIRYYSQLYFVDNYRTDLLRIVFEVPDWLELDLRRFNFDEADIAVQSEVRNGVRHTEFTRKDVAPRPREESAPGPSHIFPHLVVIPVSYNLGGTRKEIFSGTGDLYRWYRNLAGEIEDKPEVLQPLVDGLLDGAESEQEKIERIFYWVQDHIRYIAFEDGIAGFRPEAAYNVYDKRYGDCKGMANLTRAMLRLAGFDARLTWIGTNRLAYDYSTPSLVVDNHMICSVVSGGQRYFLDPTEKFIGLGEYAERIQGRQVLIEDGDDFILDRVPEVKPEANLTEWKLDLTLEGENLTGSGSYTWNGEGKKDLFNVAANLSGEDFRKGVAMFLSDGSRDIIPSELELKGFEDRSTACGTTFNIRMRNRVNAFGDEVYVNLDHFRDFGSHLIPDTRVLPLQLDSKMDYKGSVELVIPEGYSVAYVPEPIEIESDWIHIEVKYRRQGDNLVYEKRITAPQTLIRPEAFREWNEAIRSLRKFYDDPVILKKKSN